MDQGHAWMNPVVLDFPIREGANVEGEYEGFIGLLRHKLADHPKRQEYINDHGDWLQEHPLLPVQLAIQPARWIHINLILQDEDGEEKTRTTIAVRDDNVYLMGFKNRHDKWYEFGKEGQSVPFIAGSTFLGCDVGYPGLAGGWANLVSLSLTKYDVIRAIRGLSDYQQTVPADDETKRHLVRLCVIICECARMIPHHGAVSQRWDGADRTGITREQAANIKDWSKMSKELLGAPYPEENRCFHIVHLLHNSPPERILGQQDRQGQASGGGGSSQQGQGSSRTQMPSMRRPTSSSGAQEQKGQTGDKSVRTRPLLEVISVTANFARGIDRIVVFDGKRGQIIYKHGHGQSQHEGHRYPNQLALTGPYKAISAAGSFAIQVCGRQRSGTDTSHESSESVMGEMFWDCYADNIEYDKVLTRDIISTGTGQHNLARVEYRVWSDAVEATLEVNLLLPAGITHVHGEISTRCVPLDYQPVLLFSRGWDEKVELVPSGGADSMVPLELTRSVIAVPMLRRGVQIRVQLRVAYPDSKDPVILNGHINFYLDKQKGEIRINQQYGNFFVPVSWAGVSDPKGSGASHGSSQGAASSPSRQGAEQTSEKQVKVQVNMSSPGFHLSPLKPDNEFLMGMD